MKINNISKSILAYSAWVPDMKAKHIAVLIYIAEINNELDGASWIKVSRDAAQRIAGIRTAKAYRGILEDLVHMEIIKIYSYSDNDLNPFDRIEIDERFVERLNKSLTKSNLKLNVYDRI